MRAKRRRSAHAVSPSAVPVSTSVDRRWRRACSSRIASLTAVGGVAIFAGLLTGIAASLAVGRVPAHRELAGILAGAAIVFLAGLVDDVRHLTPLAKIAAQLAAAGVVLWAGVKV